MMDSILKQVFNTTKPRLPNERVPARFDWNSHNGRCGTLNEAGSLVPNKTLSQSGQNGINALPVNRY